MTRRDPHLSRRPIRRDTWGWVAEAAFSRVCPLLPGRLSSSGSAELEQWDSCQPALEKGGQGLHLNAFSVSRSVRFACSKSPTICPQGKVGPMFEKRLFQPLKGRIRPACSQQPQLALGWGCHCSVPASRADLPTSPLPRVRRLQTQHVPHSHRLQGGEPSTVRAARADSLP